MWANLRTCTRRIFSGALAAVFALLTPLYVFAEGNLLENYQGMDWQGDKLFYDQYSGCLYFEGNAESEKQTASLSVNIDPDSTGFFFCADGGNGRGNDSGYLNLTVYDKEHKSLFSTSTGNIEGFGNYSRFSIGDEEHYYPIPKEAASIEIAFTANQKDSGQRVNIYFRNFSLLFSQTKPLLLPDPMEQMNSKAGLSKVEVGVSDADHWLWIIIVFLVALTFLLIAKWKQRYSTPKVMKATDRKNRM